MAKAKDVCPNYERCAHKEGTMIRSDGVCPDCGTYVGKGARARMHHAPSRAAAFMISMARYDGGANPDH